MVRIHRAVAVASFSGLVPVGLKQSPVLPVIEHALESGSAETLGSLLHGTLDAGLRRRFDEAMLCKSRAKGDVDADRKYVQAKLDLETWAHALHDLAVSSAQDPYAHVR